MYAACRYGTTVCACRVQWTYRWLPKHDCFAKFSIGHVRFQSSIALHEQYAPIGPRHEYCKVVGGRISHATCPINCHVPLLQIHLLSDEREQSRSEHGIGIYSSCMTDEQHKK